MNPSHGFHARFAKSASQFKCTQKNFLHFSAVFSLFGTISRYIHIGGYANKVVNMAKKRNKEEMKKEGKKKGREKERGRARKESEEERRGRKRRGRREKEKRRKGERGELVRKRNRVRQTNLTHSAEI